jgi:hypothetical protein
VLGHRPQPHARRNCTREVVGLLLAKLVQPSLRQQPALLTQDLAEHRHVDEIRQWAIANLVFEVVSGVCGVAWPRMGEAPGRRAIAEINPPPGSPDEATAAWCSDPLSEARPGPGSARPRREPARNRDLTVTAQQQLTG